MPWPEPLGLLLAKPDSRAGQMLRWSLRGLRASLQAARDEVPDDPGRAELDGLLAELGALVESAGSLPGPSLPVEAPAEPVSLPAAEATGPRLLPLAEAAAADARFGEMLRGSPIRKGSDEDIWHDVQRLLLRAPPDLAEDWKKRSLDLAARLGAREDESRVEALPLGCEEVLYPGLAGTIEVSGLRADMALDSRVEAPADADLRFLAGLTSAWLWFARHDPHLHHCLQSVFRFGVRPLAGEQRSRYEAELLRRWNRVRVGGAGEKDRLKGLLELDEALHSLVHQPPADQASWWGLLLGQARDTLFRARDRAAGAGCHAHFQVLGGGFADVNRLAPDSLQVDDGIPGEVTACLRVWARLDGEELKGRVLFRAPREES